MLIFFHHLNVIFFLDDLIQMLKELQKPNAVQLKNYITNQKNKELDLVLKLIQNLNHKEFKEDYHSIDKIKGKIPSELKGFVPVNNLDGENSFFSAISIALFGDSSKFYFSKLGILYNIIVANDFKNLPVNFVYDKNFYNIVAKTFKKQIKVYTSTDNKIQVFGDEKLKFLVMIMLDQTRNHFVSFLTKPINSNN